MSKKPDRPEPSPPVAQLPAACRIVQYRGRATEAFGNIDWHPAIITRVLDEGILPRLNLKVLFDSGPVVDRSAIAHENKDEPRAWRWPPRIG